MLVHLHFSEKLWGGPNTVSPPSLGILEPYQVLNELEANDFAGLATDHEIFARVLNGHGGDAAVDNTAARL